MQRLGKKAPDLGRICLKLFIETLRETKKTDVATIAGSLAFTTVLSIAPLLAVAFYVFKLFGGLDYAYAKILPYLLDVLSEGTGEIVAYHLDQFIRQVHAKAVGWIGIAGLLLTWILTYMTIVQAFNRIWRVDRPKSFQHRVLRALTLMTVGPVLVAASIALTTAVAAQIANFPFSSQLLAFCLSTMLFTLVYALVPMAKVPLKPILIGSLIPAALLEFAKYGYAIYAARMVSYSAFYGSFAVIPLFLLWIYISWCITLYGAVWVHVLQTKLKRAL
ncbi:MAG: YhjD/YihY/BrkB family envelope integrity protein [Bdellovibrionota bacterium]